MFWFYYIIGPILGGIIAMSGLIAKKAPNAQEALNKILPYKAFIGVGLLVAFALGAIEMMGEPGLGVMFKINKLFGTAIVIVLAANLLLGFMLGMPQIAKWIPGDSAPEVKAANLSAKLVPFEVPLGILGIVGGVLMLLFKLEILKLM